MSAAAQGDKALQLAMLRAAEAEVGVREQGGENKGPRIEDYMGATWMPKESVHKGFAWCAAFITWCAKQACAELGVDDRWVYLGADAKGWEKHGRDHGWQLLNRNAKAFPGDLVTYDFVPDAKADHIGIVIQDRGEEIETVEGNTNGDGGREGDGVYRKIRSKRLVKCFIRLPWEGMP